MGVISGRFALDSAWTAPTAVFVTGRLRRGACLRGRSPWGCAALVLAVVSLSAVSGGRSQAERRGLWEVQIALLERLQIMYVHT